MNKKKSAGKASAGKKKGNVVSLDSLPSMQSMEGLLAGIGIGMGKRMRNDALDKAQQIMYDAWDAETRQQGAALAIKALEVSADCADAYVFLAQETAKSLDEAIQLYRKGVQAGERALGKKTFKNDAGYFWGLLETRPYMRARAGLAQCLWDAGCREEAVLHYWDILRLNPNDNQGIRDMLMPSLIEMGRDEDAEKLFGQFKDDGMAVWMYSRALLEFRKNGDSPDAVKSLKAALRENKHVPGYLLCRRKMPVHLPEHYGFGDENEAILYAYGNMGAWMSTPGAFVWLAGRVR